MRTSHLRIVRRTGGFTLVELLIVIVVIAILAAISVVAYNGVQDRARISTMQADLHNAATQLTVFEVDNEAYPTPNLPASIAPSANNSYEYTSDGTTYCLTVTSSSPNVSSYYISDTNGTATEGACAGHTGSGGGGSVIADGAYIQDVTAANCPTTRTRVVDARDSRTYWVQELADGNCWMLTNLAYAGGGTATYSDTVTLSNGTADGSGTYTVAKYYIPTGANPTTEPTNPSTSTSGTGQYGYLYNWCGAMGGQTGTAACANGSTPAPNLAVSVCPSGWGLPTGGVGAEFDILNDAVNSGSTATDAGLRTTLHAQYGGLWSGGFSFVGSYGYYRSQTQASAANTYGLSMNSTSVADSVQVSKAWAIAVRCVAN